MMKQTHTINSQHSRSRQQSQGGIDYIGSHDFTNQTNTYRGGDLRAPLSKNSQRYQDDVNQSYVSERAYSEQQQYHVVDREQEVVISAIKEDLVDAINDLKSKTEIWNISPDTQKKCDQIIKTMVLCSND